ncbi:MAG TPA: sugar phosphate isomerase/epimerase [Chloroflexota bacterium]|nr:sugar phosphate isomerase/epimerase [Chloroflexota bacterium]
MRIGYSTWSMPKLSADDAIGSIAQIGYDSIELTVIPNWSTELDTLDSAERKRIRGLLDRNNLQMPAIAGHRTLLADDPAEHAENWRRLTGAIDLCVDWAGQAGPPALDTTTGGKSGEFEQIKELMIERVGELCDYAAEKGVVIAIEPHVGNALDTPERVLWLLSQVGRPNLKVAFDISHFNVQGIPIETSVTAMAPHSVFTHVKDERGIAPDHEFLIPGEGEFDYVRYLKAMHTAGYTEDICVEISLMVQRRENYDAVAAAHQSFDILSAAFREAGVPRS